MSPSLSISPRLLLLADEVKDEEVVRSQVSDVGSCGQKRARAINEVRPGGGRTGGHQSDGASSN